MASIFSFSPSFFLDSILLASHAPVHLPPHSPEFLFYSLLSINVFSFPRSQNFLIISTKMRDSLSRTEYDSIGFFFVVLNKEFQVLTPTDRRILFTQHCLVIFNFHCISSLILFFIYCAFLFLAY